MHTTSLFSLFLCTSFSSAAPLLSTFFSSAAPAPAPVAPRLSLRQFSTFPIVRESVKRDTGSSTNPYCYYDENKPGEGTCTLANKNTGNPNPDYCVQAYQAVCEALSTLPANNDTVYAQGVGNGTVSGNQADCYAVANNGGNQPTLDYDTCVQKFMSIMGCLAPEQHADFNPQCAGGSIDEQFNTNDPGKTIDGNAARFGLGTPLSLGIDEASGEGISRPAPQLNADRTDGGTKGASGAPIPAGEGAQAAPAAAAPAPASRVGSFIAGGFLGSEIGD